MTPRVIRAAEGRRMPWKNGGGETVELLAHPAGAGLDGFDWRVSMARVAVDGPFSAFPGVDRTLTVLDGEGLELALAGRDPVRLTPASPPFPFAADVPCAGRLLGGPVTDLNVMTRRDQFTHVVAPAVVADGMTVGGGEGTTILVCREGEIACSGSVVLARHDALVLAGRASIRAAARQGPAAALVVTIRPA